MTNLTHREIELGRHALGLPNMQRKSYRNRYYVAAGTLGALAWDGMVKKGAAEKYAAASGQTLDLYCMTDHGAVACLKEKERLCPEDLPNFALKATPKGGA